MTNASNNPIALIDDVLQSFSNDLNRLTPPLRSLREAHGRIESNQRNIATQTDECRKKSRSVQNEAHNRSVFCFVAPNMSSKSQQTEDIDSLAKRAFEEQFVDTINFLYKTESSVTHRIHSWCEKLKNLQVSISRIISYMNISSQKNNFIKLSEFLIADESIERKEIMLQLMDEKYEMLNEFLKQKTSILNLVHNDNSSEWLQDRALDSLLDQCRSVLKE